MQAVRGWARILLGIGLMILHSIGTAAGGMRMPPRERARYRAKRQRAGCRILCKAFGFRVEVAGEAPPPGPALYVANHITGLDPIVIGTAVEVSFAGKVEITGWPVLGWIADTHGLIGVVRERRSSARELVEAIKRRLAEGVSVMVFPEGGIGWGDALLPFKTGAFEAVASGGTERVLPVFMDVTALSGKPMRAAAGRYALSYNHHTLLFGHLAHMLSYRSVDFQVHFGPPVDTVSLDRKALADKTYAAVWRLQHQKQ